MKRNSQQLSEKIMTPMELETFFIEKSENWPYPVVHEECYTTDVFHDLNINAETAYTLIDAAIKIIIDNAKSKFILNALALLLKLASISDTTEIPEALYNSWNSLEEIIKNRKEEKYLSDYWDYICRHYRKLN